MANAIAFYITLDAYCQLLLSSPSTSLSPFHHLFKAHAVCPTHPEFSKLKSDLHKRIFRMVNAKRMNVLSTTL
jgi:hypothetical protein